MIFVAEIRQCTSTTSLDRLNLGTIPYGALHKGSRKAAKTSPKTTPGGHRDGICHPPVHNDKNPTANEGKRTGRHQRGHRRRSSTHHCPDRQGPGLQTAVRAYINGQQTAMERRFDQRDLAAFDRMLAYFITLNSHDSSLAGKKSRS